MGDLITETDLRSLPRAQLTKLVEDLGGKAVHANAMFKEIHQNNAQTSDLLNISETPKALLENIKTREITQLRIVNRSVSQDTTIKYLCALEDNNTIETVLIPQHTDKGAKYCVCVSSQVGCAMKCDFCATGTLGIKRNLSAGEIVAQLTLVKEDIKRMAPQKKTVIDSIVFMGMGEPLNNFENLVAAIDIITDDYGFNFASRKITVSTCGIVPKIKMLGERTRVNLALSLHAVDDTTREKLMPINNAHNIHDVLAACRAYPTHKEKSVMIEYILIDELNDTLADAEKLAQLLDFPCLVNLIPYNEIPGKPYKRPREQQVHAFRDRLIALGIKTFLRESRGTDVAAACGMLAGGDL